MTTTGEFADPPTASAKGDIVTESIELLANPLPWFLKGEDIYVTCKKAFAYAYTLPYADRAVTAISAVTDTILTRTQIISSDEARAALVKVDELLTETLNTADHHVEVGKQRVVTAVRELKSAVETTVAKQTEQVTASAKEVHSQLSSTVTFATERSIAILNTAQEVALEAYKNPSGSATAAYTAGVGYVSDAQGAIKGTLDTTVTQAGTLYTSTQNTISAYVSQAQGTIRDTYDSLSSNATTQVQGAVSSVGSTLKGLPYVGPLVTPYVEQISGLISSRDATRDGM